MASHGRKSRNGIIAITWTLLCGLCTFAASCLVFSHGPAAVLLVFASAWMCHRATSSMLAHKRESHERWWDKSAGVYASYLGEHGHAPETDAPDPNAAAAAIWADEVRRVAAERGLTDEERSLAETAGLRFASEPNWAPAQSWLPCASPAFLPCTIACLLAIAALCSLCQVAGMGLAASGFMSCIAVTCLVAAAVDISSRLIPYELCVVLLGFSIAFQISSQGLLAAIAALGLGIGVSLAMWAIGRVLSRHGKAQAIGTGDTRMTVGVICACGASGVIAGSLGFAISFALWFSVAFALGRANRKTQVPMAPFLAVWAISGMAIPPLAAAFA